MAKYRHETARRKLRAVPTASKVGMAPGTMQYVGPREADQTLASLIEYGPEPDAFYEKHFTSLEEGQGYHPQHPLLWLNLHGLANIALLKVVGRRFGLHPLVLEDILNTEQRPKVEIFNGYVFICIRLVSVNEEGEVSSEHVSMVLGKNYVLTFQEKPSGTFQQIREGLKSSQSQLRRFGSDYLVYTLLDKLVDRYFLVLEAINERCEDLDDVISLGPKPVQLQEIQALRRTMQYVKRGLWPLREVMNTLQRDEADFFRDETQLYLRDVYDHVVQMIESGEALRDLVNSLQDNYMSLQSNRMNIEMRRLTVLTTIFMPLTLIAGIYGMNFEFMPELHWKWGYFAVLGVMSVIGLGLGLFFRAKRWF
jgi:magnesium transporter